MFHVLDEHKKFILLINDLIYAQKKWRIRNFTLNYYYSQIIILSLRNYVHNYDKKS